jgi:hypothetical protein
MVPVVPIVPNVPTVEKRKDDINELVVILRNDWNDWNLWNDWNDLFFLHQKRRNDLRQLFRLLVGDVMAGAFDGDDFRVGKKLRSVAAH